MTTVQQIYFKALSLYDEISKTGTIDTTKTADYLVRTPSIVDMLQKELVKVSGLTKKYETIFSPIPNMLGLTLEFDIKEFKGEEFSVDCSKGGARAYYFECDGDGTAYVEDLTASWNILATIPMSQLTSGFKAYKGALTPTQGATKTRIRFTGTYYYKTINRALFDIPFAPNKIPTYSPWVKVDLPADAKEIIDVITEHPERQYTKDNFYKSEQEGNIVQLYINYYYIGRIRVIYLPIPKEIKAMSDVLEIDDLTAQAIAYGLTRWFALSEQNLDVANACYQKFAELKALSVKRTPATEEKIADVYMGSSWGWR